jgi:putative (di)nucleoside polyphosphate hydrolase
LRFTGEDKEINVKTKDPEFIDWKWIKIDELPQSIVDFKKKVYEDLVEEISKTID